MSVLALCVDHDGSLPRATRELLTAAKVVARATPPLLVAVAGADPLPAAELLSAFDLDGVYALPHPLLDGRSPEAYLVAFIEIARRTGADVLLLAGDTIARDLAPRLALRLNVPCITQCSRLEPGDDGRTFCDRPVYGGKAIARLSVHRAVVTISPHSFQPADRSDRRANIEVVPVEVPELSRVNVVRRVQEQIAGIPLEEAKVVVSGGRGIGGPEGFTLLKELAELLGGAVGASRAATDAGWVPQSWQIGLTGRRITPDVYIAVGISGASQHLAGVTGAGTIIPINIDPNAPIFDAAQVGVVADYRAVIPALIQEIHRLKKMN